jgi:hypothetical protein
MKGTAFRFGSIYIELYRTLVILIIIVTMITVQITQGVPHKMSKFRMLF